MTEAAYIRHYRDPVIASSGHGFGHWNPGDVHGTYVANAMTRDYVWLAPVESFPDPRIPRSDAESCRDQLGLVHYREKETLVALHLRLHKSIPPVYRPTVVEANPNARFRQVDPEFPAEDRWGKTVDLQLLAQSPMPTSIGGLPELVSGQLLLDDADEVHFYMLGPTKTNQSTTTSDQTFLDHLLDGTNIETIHATLCATLAP